MLIWLKKKRHFWQSAAVLICLLMLFFVPFFVFAGSNGPLDDGMLAPGSGKNAGQAAQNNLDQLAQPVYGADEQATSLNVIITNVMNAILAIIGVLLFAYLFHAGYLWMTASGNEDQVKKAKDQIRNAIIGLIIIIAAYAISNFVLNALSGMGGGGGGPTGSP